MDAQQKRTAILLTFISLIGYFFVAYFLERTHFYQLLFIWIGLFASTYYLLKTLKNHFYILVGIAILFRLIFLISIPNLSQDFYRFIWDGRMLFAGYNPYISLPLTFIEQQNYPIPQAINLFSGMGDFNGSHYTNYAPVNQLCFFIAALFANKSILGSVVVMRILIITADVGILYFGKKLLKKMNLPINNIFWYALNPLVIIELTGNLHFESVMLFFLIFSLYQLQQQKWMWAAILLGLSVSVKLIPLLFLPLFYQWFTSTTLSNLTSTTLSNLTSTLSADRQDSLSNQNSVIANKTKQPSLKERFLLKLNGFKKLLAFYGITLTTIVLLFLPFYSSKFVDSYTNSVGLWFKTFEYNASFYYIFREIGYLFRGWNEIAIIGKIMPFITLLFLGSITFFRKNKTPIQLVTALLFGLSLYYFFTTTVHPWYLATLVALSVFTKYKFSLVWSLAIVFSYHVYATNPWKENLYWVALEYLIVFGVLAFEISRNTLKKTF